MSDVNTSEILERFRTQGVDEVNYVVGIWEIQVDGYPVKLRIKVERGADGMYIAWPNYTIRKCGLTPHVQHNAQDALRDTLGKLLGCLPRPKMGKQDFELDEDF